MAIPETTTPRDSRRILWLSTWAFTIGAGNVGAAGTKLLVALVPGVLTLIPLGGYFGGWISGGWRIVHLIYAALLLATALAVQSLCPVRDPRPVEGRPLGELLAPLKHKHVWRFSLYTWSVRRLRGPSAWLPNYYVHPCSPGVEIDLNSGDALGSFPRFSHM